MTDPTGSELGLDCRPWADVGTEEGHHGLAPKDPKEQSWERLTDEVSQPRPLSCISWLE